MKSISQMFCFKPNPEIPSTAPGWKSLIIMMMFCSHQWLGMPAQAAPPIAGKLSSIDERVLARSMQFWIQGQTGRALEFLGRLSSPGKQHPFNLYWRAVYMQDLQDLSGAAEYYIRAAAAGAMSEFKDIYYRQGQCAFGLEQWERAAEYFGKARSKSYRVDASTFYEASALKKLGKEEEALGLEKTLAQDPKTNVQLRQLSYLSWGDYQFEQAMAYTEPLSKRKFLEEKVRPLFQKVIILGEGQEQSSAEAVKSAQERLSQIDRMQSENIYRYGYLIPKQSWLVRLSQGLHYDTNVLNEPQDRLIKVSNKESPFSKTTGFAKNEFLLFDRWSLSPELYADGTFHLNRGNLDVFANDNMNVTPALRSRWDHLYQNRLASVLLEYDFSYSTRDYLSQRRQLYYSRYSLFTVGYRASFLERGSTTIKVHLKLLEMANKSLSAVDPGFTVTQSLRTFYQWMLQGSFSFDNNWTNDRYFALRNYRASLSHVIPQLFPDTSWDVSLAHTWIHPVNQYDDRGLERNLVFGSSLVYYFGDRKNFSFTLNYAYQAQSSKRLDTYAYKKHTGGATFAVLF